MQSLRCANASCSKQFQVEDDDSSKRYCSKQCRKRAENKRYRDRLHNVVHVEGENVKLKDRARDLLRDLLTLLDATDDTAEMLYVRKALRMKYARAIELREAQRRKPGATVVGEVTGRTSARQAPITTDVDSTPELIIVDEVGI